MILFILQIKEWRCRSWKGGERVFPHWPGLALIHSLTHSLPEWACVCMVYTLTTNHFNQWFYSLMHYIIFPSWSITILLRRLSSRRPRHHRRHRLHKWSIHKMRKIKRQKHNIKTVTKNSVSVRWTVLIMIEWIDREFNCMPGDGRLDVWSGRGSNKMKMDRTNKQNKKKGKNCVRIRQIA